MISVGIVGGTGYTGVELLRILLRHPKAQVRVLTSRTEAGKPVADMFPNLRAAATEGIDELWGEPFRAFSIPLDDFFESRYIKIGQTMRDIDIAAAMIVSFTKIPAFAAVERRSASLRTPPASRPRRCAPTPTFSKCGRNWSLPPNGSPTSPLPVSAAQRGVSDGLQLLRNGRDLVFDIARARADAQSTRDYIARCEVYLATGWAPLHHRDRAFCV